LTCSTASSRRFDHDLDDPVALLAIQIGKLARGAERCQSMHGGADQIIDQSPENILFDPAALVRRRHQIGKDPAQLDMCHVPFRIPLTVCLP
jgi:hypothetical protein